MQDTIQLTPTIISLAELDDVLNQAQRERWQYLALMGPRFVRQVRMPATWPIQRIFCLRQALGPSH